MTVKCDGLSPLDARVRWFRCQLCDGRFDYDCDADLALAWEHWKTYSNGPLTDPHRGWAAVSLAYRMREADYTDEAMSVLCDVAHSGIAGFMRWPHVDVMLGALFFVYWYKTLCHCLGIRDSLVVDDAYDDPRHLAQRDYARGLADEYLAQLGDPDGQAVQVAMGLITLLVGGEAEESNLKDLGPEEVVDFLTQEFARSKERRTPEHSSQVRKEMDAAGVVRPAPGT